MNTPLVVIYLCVALAMGIGLVSMVGAAVNYVLPACAPSVWLLLLGGAIAGHCGRCAGCRPSAVSCPSC